jgi:FkbM family methyltransferase
MREPGYGRGVLERLLARIQWVRDALPIGGGRRSFAQEGEDLVLARIFGGQREGIYVDVGAHHPRRFSNTCMLYRRGWHGVNIDATPGSMRLFALHRPRDLNLELGVAATDGTLDFHVFDEPALNTFDRVRANQLDKPPYRMVEVRKVACRPLSSILREHSIGPIDLLTVDVEGLDEQVLATLDWEASQPRVVLTEHFSRDLGAILSSSAHEEMTARGYHLIAKTFNSVFYIRG